MGRFFRAGPARGAQPEKSPQRNSGENESAVAALERFRSYGLFPYWRQEVYDNPALMSLRPNPQYQALLDDYRAFAEEERVRARELLEVES